MNEVNPPEKEVFQLASELTMSFSCPQLTLLTPKETPKKSCLRLLDDLAKEFSSLLAPIRHRFFFVLKPPEIRLRLPVRQDTSASISCLDDWRAAALRRGLLVSSHWSTHHPELFQFGGPVAYPVAEKHFISESEVFLKHRGILYPNSRLTATEDLLSNLLVIVVADLLARLTEDSWEAWDCVARMAYSRGMLSDLEQATHPDPRSQSAIFLEWARNPKDAFAGVDPSYNECYTDFAIVNASTAKRLRQISESISFGIRNMAATLALFMLNRSLTDMLEQKNIFIHLSQLLNPAKHIRLSRTAMEAN
jgi:thiopeptide-type bacteriocin biosynthesis protein